MDSRDRNEALELRTEGEEPVAVSVQVDGPRYLACFPRLCRFTNLRSGWLLKAGSGFICKLLAAREQCTMRVAWLVIRQFASAAYTFAVSAAAVSVTVGRGVCAIN